MILLFDVVSDIVYVSFAEWSHFIYFVESRVFCDPIVSLHLHFNYQSYYFKYMFKKKTNEKQKWKRKKQVKKNKMCMIKQTCQKLEEVWVATFFYYSG